MTRRTSSRSAKTRATRDALAIASGAPQVIATRVARMAAHGMNPNASDRREMKRMVAEKTHAFGEAWMAMGAQALRMQQGMLQQALQPRSLMPLMQLWQPWFTIAAKPAGWPGFVAPAISARRSRAGRTLTAQTTRQLTQLNSNLTQLAAAGLAPLSRRVSSNVKRLGTKRR